MYCRWAFGEVKHTLVNLDTSPSSNEDLFLIGTLLTLKKLSVSEEIYCTALHIAMHHGAESSLAFGTEPSVLCYV